jgi:hypothetical protein
MKSKLDLVNRWIGLAEDAIEALLDKAGEILKVILEKIKLKLNA